MVTKKEKLQLSRRDFLRMAGVGAASTAFAITGMPALGQDGPTASEANIVMMYAANEISDDEIAAFNDANDGITLSRIDFDVTRFFAMLAAGTAPHLLRTQAPDIPQFVARNVPMNLQSYFDASSALNEDDLVGANNYYRVTSPTETGVGDLYGMAKDWAPDGFVWINTATFEAVGAEVPDAGTPITETQLAELAAAITQTEGDRTLVTGFNFHTGFIDRYWMEFAQMAGSSMFAEDFSSASIADNEAVVQAIRWHFDMQQAGTMNSPLNPSVNWFGPDFANGQLGIVQTGYWFSGQLRAFAGDPEQPAIGEAFESGQYQLHPMFTWNGTRSNMCITAAGAVIVNPNFREAGDSDNDAAWAAFEWFMSGEPATNRAAGGWGLPALTSLNDLIPNDSAFDQQTREVVMAELEYANDVLAFNPNLAGGEPGIVGSMYLNNLEDALSGNLSFDDLLGLIEEETNFAIEEGMFNM